MAVDRTTGHRAGLAYVLLPFVPDTRETNTYWLRWLAMDTFVY
jgi:hypothetical protein